MIPRTASNLRTLRRLAGMTQREAAALIGRSHGTVSMFERTGQGVSPDNLEKLASELGAIAVERQKAAQERMK